MFNLKISTMKKMILFMIMLLFAMLSIQANELKYTQNEDSIEVNYEDSESFKIETLAVVSLKDFSIKTFGFSKDLSLEVIVFSNGVYGIKTYYEGNDYLYAFRNNYRYFDPSKIGLDKKVKDSLRNIQNKELYLNYRI